MPQTRVHSLLWEAEAPTGEVPSSSSNQTLGSPQFLSSLCPRCLEGPGAPINHGDAQTSSIGRTWQRTPNLLNQNHTLMSFQDDSYTHWRWRRTTLKEPPWGQGERIRTPTWAARGVADKGSDEGLPSTHYVAVNHLSMIQAVARHAPFCSHPNSGEKPGD